MTFWGTGYSWAWRFRFPIGEGAGGAHVAAGASGSPSWHSAGSDGLGWGLSRHEARVPRLGLGLLATVGAANRDRTHSRFTRHPRRLPRPRSPHVAEDRCDLGAASHLARPALCGYRGALG